MIKLTITIESSPHPTLAGATISTTKTDIKCSPDATAIERKISLLYGAGIDRCHQVLSEAGYCQTIVNAHGKDECDKARRIIDSMRGVN